MQPLPPRCNAVALYPDVARLDIFTNYFYMNTITPGEGHLLPKDASM